MHKVIRFAINTKFNEMGHFDHPMAVDLLSIGMTNIDKIDDDCYDGANGIYRVVSDFNHAAASCNPHLREVVLPRLYIGQGTDIERQLMTHPMADMHKPLKAYLSKQITEEKDANAIEIWSDNGVYDNYALSRIFGARHALSNYLKEMGVAKISFKNFTDIEQPPITIDPKPTPCTRLQGHAYYDAYDLGRIIRWTESESKKHCIIPVVKGAKLG